MRRRSATIVVGGLLAICICAQLRAATVIINADQFAVGDGLAQVNAFAAPLGIVLDAIHPSSFQVELDASGDKAFQVLPEAARADMLANFARPVDLVRVTFGSMEHTRASYIALHNQSQNPVGPFDGFVDFRIHAGRGDVVLEYLWTLPGTPSEVRAAIMEQDIAQPNSVYVRAIEVHFVSQGTPGDIDLDGDVDRRDAALFSQYFGTSSDSIWNTGDFDGDGATTVHDFALLQTHLSPSVPSPQTLATAVPEPAASWLALLALTLIGPWRLARLG